MRQSCNFVNVYTKFCKYLQNIYMNIAPMTKSIQF